MNKNDNSKNNPSPRDDAPETRERIDENPPYGPARPDAVEQFRRLLADLIARQITSERRKPPTKGDEIQP